MQPPRSSHTFDPCNSHLIPILFPWFSTVFLFMSMLFIRFMPFVAYLFGTHQWHRHYGLGNPHHQRRWQKVRLSWGLYDYKMIRLLHDYMTPIQHYEMIEYDYFMIMIWLWWFSGHFQPWFDATHQAVSGAVSEKPCRGSGDVDDFDVDSEDLDGELIDALLDVIGTGHSWSCGVVGVRFGSCFWDLYIYIIYIYIYMISLCVYEFR